MFFYLLLVIRSEFRILLADRINEIFELLYFVRVVSVIFSHLPNYDFPLLLLFIINDGQLVDVLDFIINDGF